MNKTGYLNLKNNIYKTKHKKPSKKKAIFLKILETVITISILFLIVLLITIAKN